MREGIVRVMSVFAIYARERFSLKSFQRTEANKFEHTEFQASQNKKPTDNAKVNKKLNN